MVLLIVRGLLRRPSLAGTPTVTICSVHIRNVVAKKRDASTDLLQRLHAHMVQHNVDFIRGDFNMSAFSTLGEIFSDPEFANNIVNARASSSCPSVLFERRLVPTAVTSSTTPTFQTVHFPVVAWNGLLVSTSANASAKSFRSKPLLDPLTRET